MPRFKGTTPAQRISKSTLAQPLKPKIKKARKVPAAPAPIKKGPPVMESRGMAPHKSVAPRNERAAARMNKHL